MGAVYICAVDYHPPVMKSVGSAAEPSLKISNWLPSDSDGSTKTSLDFMFAPDVMTYRRAEPPPPPPEVFTAMPLERGPHSPRGEKRERRGLRIFKCCAAGPGRLV